MTYDRAVIVAGFDHHSRLNTHGEVPGRTFDTGHTRVDLATGEILKLHAFKELPYYGEALQRHVGFGSGKLSDTPEKRFGRIANPTVHIGLNQVRLVVNALTKRYGHPSQVIVELARDLKQSKDHSRKDQEPFRLKSSCSCQRCVTARQAENQRRNDRHRVQIAGILGISPERVRGVDMQKMVLWEELSFDPATRCCPYSGVQISAAMLFSDEVEIEHILPFSKTLDDSLNNKTVSMRRANRYKGNDTPWEAFGQKAIQGFDYAAILQRAELMPRQKRSRFAEDGMERWLKDGKGFLARALNDTKYLSKVAREYLALICPQDTRVIPGLMTAMLRGKFGLNHVLGLDGEKNRNDHRHHAVDACVIGVTDQGMLQKFAKASASTRDKQLNRLVEDMPAPWGETLDSYRAHVERAVANIWVSHKPDHGHEGAMHNDTAYGLLGNGRVSVHKQIEGKRTYVEDNLKVIEFGRPNAAHRHGVLPDGSPRPYKGYKGDSNYCIEIVRNEKGKWEGEVISTFDAYQIERKHGAARLRHPTLSMGNKLLVDRFIIDDVLRLEIDGAVRTLRIASINTAGRLSLASHQEANVDARNRDAAGSWRYTYKQAGSLFSAKARRVTISPIGELRDPGFKP